jgi:hypothetical protein
MKNVSYNQEAKTYKAKKQTYGEQTRTKEKCKTSPRKEKQSTIEQKSLMQASSKLMACPWLSITLG